MAQIRHELHEDVQGVVKGAEAATDWRRYVKNYPWVTLGLAFGIGYLIVPKRQQSQLAGPVHFAAGDSRGAVTYEAPKAPQPEKKGKGIFKTVLGLATPFLLRSAQGYALQYFEQYLAQKMAEQQSPLGNFAASFLGNNASGQPGPDPTATSRQPS